MLDSILNEYSNAKNSKSELKLVKVSKPKQTLTAEQEAILEADEQVLKVTAYAGSGKTFVLENFAKKNIKSRGLYIAFNRDLKLEAEKRFPSSVKCLTMHGLAYKQFGIQLSGKLNKPVYPQHLVNYFDVPDSISDLYSKLIYNSVINFTYSRDSFIQKKHITFGEELSEISKILTSSDLTELSTSKILSDIELIWQHLIDPESELGTMHDVYLKLFQLHKPKLPFNTILLDEAQDVNPAMLDIFERQKCRKVLTGDPYQSIYQFRKAIDGMTNSKADKNYYLTKSFRFGQTVANVASTLLPLRGEMNPVFGREDIQSQVGFAEIPADMRKFLSYSNKAVITRTNAQIFAESVRFAEMGYKVYVEGGEKMLNFDLITDLERLKNGQAPKDSFLKTFHNSAKAKPFEQLEEFASANGISEWSFRCKVVNKYGKDLNKAINVLKNSLTQVIGNDTIIITNVHKSKGLEYDAVLLGDDFDLQPFAEGKSGVSLIKESSFEFEKKSEALNLIYVALTRAKHYLCFTSQEMLDYVNYAHKLILNKPVIWLPSQVKTTPPLLSKNVQDVYRSVAEKLRERNVG